MDNQRNLIVAIILSAAVLFGWSFLSDRFIQPANPPATKIVDGKQVALPKPEAAPDGPAAVRDRAAVLRESQRVTIRAPRVAGSINLRGARIDDLVLPTYGETIARNSPPVRLLSPGGTKDAYFAGFGWSGDGIAAPGPDTVWQADAPALTPERPVTLSWANGRGQTFRIRIAVDRDFMFTITQAVENRGTGTVAAKPYALVSRVGHSKDPDGWTMHTGPIGTFNGKTSYGPNFSDLDEGEAPRFQSTGGWIGFGDKYWLTALAPAQRQAVDAGFRGAGQQYQADFTQVPQMVAAGRTAATTFHFFAGAKEVKLLDRYEEQLGIARFAGAIDWGWFEIVEKPIFYLLDWLFQHIGNFGVAIICLTLIIRGAMFPIAQRQFASMAAMRVVQPKLKALQERHKDDKAKLQQEMMALYKAEKVNPLAGCLPIFLQIPIFYALYKVLMLSIEMRHQPFMLWIKDLSAPDPLTPVNLFGFLPFDPPGMLHLGVLAILLGVTMWVQFKMNPAQMDPAQQQIMGLMPWIMMLFFASLAAGLQLYYVMSNLVGIAQQAWLYSRYPGLKATGTAVAKT